jgi:uncharacterized protein (TIGR02118 family)
MIHVTVAYPRSEGSTFDSDYWIGTHMPMVASGWPQVKKWEADLGVDGQPFHAVAHIYFDSMEDFQAAMGEPGSGQIMGDLPNYFAGAPVMQISTVAATS